MNRYDEQHEQLSGGKPQNGVGAEPEPASPTCSASLVEAQRWNRRHSMRGGGVLVHGALCLVHGANGGGCGGGRLGFIGNGQCGGYFLMPQEAFTRVWNENRGMHWIDAVLHTKRRFRVSYKR